MRAGQEVMSIKHLDPAYKYEAMHALSTVSGVVSAVTVSEGDQVSKGQKLATVTDPSKLRVLAEIPADDVQVMRPGISGELAMAGAKEPVKLVLKGVSPFVDPSTGTATCEFAVDSKPIEVLPGPVGRLKIRAGRDKEFGFPNTRSFFGKVRRLSVSLGTGKSSMCRSRSGSRRRAGSSALRGFRKMRF